MRNTYRKLENMYNFFRRRHMKYVITFTHLFTRLNFLILMSLIEIPPHISFQKIFHAENILISHPCLLNFRKCSSQDISTVTINLFNIFPKFFCHIVSFVRISEVTTLYFLFELEINVTVICCIKTNNKE